MNPTATFDETERADARRPVVLFGIGIAIFVLFLFTIVVKLGNENDFPREAWGPYRLLFHGHVIGFLRTSPPYVGSLILRAPFALLAALFGAGRQGVYIATALPCVVAPGLLAGWLASGRGARPGTLGAEGRRRLWPLDLFMCTPPAVICLTGGHPEDILGAVLCVAAGLLAQRGSARAAGILLGLALINKPWALIAAPLVFALMPGDRRLSGLRWAALVTAIVMVPVLAIRMTGADASIAGLGGSDDGLFLVPQLWWFLGRDSWIAREGHIVLVAVGWLFTAAWWWLCVHNNRERPSRGSALMMLALVLFLRAALDPWDNIYYFAPFMLALMAYEDAGGFPGLTLAFMILLVVIVPPGGLLSGLGNDGHAAVFAVFALATIGFLTQRAFAPGRPRARRLYAAVSRSGV
ncbi:MAG: hypothetical protein ACRDKD_03630 [Solirubrobacteraceae bacterium]